MLRVRIRRQDLAALFQYRQSYGHQLQSVHDGTFARRGLVPPRSCCAVSSEGKVLMET